MSSPASPATRSTRGAVVAREIESEIVSGTWSAGDRIGTRRDLCERFGVSMGTVNEAMRLAMSRGLLASRSGPGGGLFVTAASTRVRLNNVVVGYQLPESTMADYLEVRDVLEPLICHEAAANRTRVDAVELKQILDDMQRHMSEPTTYIHLNWNLHRRLASCVRNAPLHSLYLTVLDFLENSMERIELSPLSAQDHLERHRELVEAVLEGSEQRLQGALRTHAESVLPPYS